MFGIRTFLLKLGRVSALLAPITYSLLPVTLYADWLHPYSEKGKRMEGFQIGAGVPVFLPMTGYNFFVGYSNKHSNHWLGRRFGFRMDFLVPRTMSATGALADNGDGYNANLNFGLMGFNINQNNVFSMDRISVDGQYMDLDGMSGRFAIDNRFVGALVDFYPFADTWFLGGIRLTGGYYIGQMNIAANMTAVNPLFGSGGFMYNVYTNINPALNQYIVANTAAYSQISAQLNWRYNGPYAGLGFDLGIFRGFKFFADAGVVFARRPPRVEQNDIQFPVMELCYMMGGAGCEGVANLHWNARPDVQAVMSPIMYQMLVANASGLPLPPSVQADLVGASHDIIMFLMGTGNPQWVDDLLTAAPGNNLVSAISALQGAGMSDLQNELDSLWNDYNRGINDLNNNLRDMRLMPMVKLGVMYRF